MSKKDTVSRVDYIGARYAWWGVKHAYLEHKNFRIHIVVSLLVLATAMWLQLPILEVAILVFAIVLGLVVEMVNTAIEAVVDLVTQEWKQSAKIAKDVAAGAMLITAVGTAIIGLLILGPRILENL